MLSILDGLGKGLKIDMFGVLGDMLFETLVAVRFCMFFEKIDDEKHVEFCLIFVDSFVTKPTLWKTDPVKRPESGVSKLGILRPQIGDFADPPTESIHRVCFFVKLSFIFGQIVENR